MSRDTLTIPLDFGPPNRCSVELPNGLWGTVPWKEDTSEDHPQHELLPRRADYRAEVLRKPTPQTEGE